jgi:phage tail-like protein
MAETAQAQNASYPLAAYNYRVTVGTESLRCSEVSGLLMEYETVQYRHGLSAWEGPAIRKFRYDKFTPLTLKRAVVHRLTFLKDWLQSDDVRSIDISLCDEKGDPAVTWHIGRAVPVKLQAPSFQARGNDAAVESLELLVSRVTIEHH